MSSRRWGEIKDPIHGYIRVSEVERAIIDTHPVQRLRGIKQLSAAHLTYPSAEHTRFQHSLGVMHVAGRIADQLHGLGLIDEGEAQTIRIAGLLHDVGHGPFSHLFEEVMERRGLTHEDIGVRVVRESQVADALEEHGLDAKEIADLAVGRLEGGEPFINQVVAGQFSADNMDYLVRDSYFTGVEYGRVDINRLIDSIDVMNGGLAMDTTALYALEAFVIARYEMFKAVYFHRTVRAAAVMLVRAMEYADDRLGFTHFGTVEEYLRLDDSNVLAQIEALKGERDRRSRTAYELGRMFRERRLLKCAYERVVHRRDPFFTNILTHGDVRYSLEEDIAKHAEVDTSFVAIDVSTAASVPYYSAQKRPSDIPVFSRDHDGSKIPQIFSELSPLVGSLIGYLDIVRIYAKQEDLRPVQEAAERIFGKEAAATKVSY
jgi:hypothetical protein